MIRKLVLTLVAAAGVVLIGTSTHGAGPGGGGPEVTLTINNNPTIDANTYALSFTGGFTAAEGWSVTDFKVVLISSVGVSRTYSGAGTGNGVWGATTTDPIAGPTGPAGQYKAFVIAVGSRTNPTAAKDFCSAVATVTCPATVPGGGNNPTPAIASYATFTFNAGSPIRAGVISGVASATVGTYQKPNPNPTNIDVGYDPTYGPVMNILPVGGGEYFRITGQWGQNPATTGSASTVQLPASPLYNVYMHMKANRKELNVIVDSQLIATEIKPNI